MYIKLIISLLFIFSINSSYAFTPQAGTWIITKEMNGKPGRGFSIDVQNNTMVMQAWAYEASGQSTFYLASGAYENNNFQGELRRYKGGRYLGSGELTGTEEPSAGMVRIKFTSGVRGLITLPGESETELIRFEFGHSKSSPNSLLGTWSIVGINETTNTSYSDIAVLTKILPATSQGTGVTTNETGSIACEQKKTEIITMCLVMRSDTISRKYMFQWSVNRGDGDTYNAAGNYIGPSFANRLREHNMNYTGVIRTQNMNIDSNSVISMMDQAWQQSSYSSE
jgi:hypothetical protein